jgi:thiol-disulfide isomerase/thioredoxin
MSLSLLAKAQNSPKAELAEFNELYDQINTQESDTVYVLNFWATWCAPCIKELPDFQAAMTEYGDKPVRFVYISLDDPSRTERVQGFIDKKAYQGQFFILKDPDPNEWINKIDPDWQGEIPATLILAPNEKKWFHSGMLTKEELISNINLYF